MNTKLLALYGLKWNPFAPGVPAAALHATAPLKSFSWRVQQLAGEGGFALLTGASGTVSKVVRIPRLWESIRPDSSTSN